MSIWIQTTTCQQKQFCQNVSMFSDASYQISSLGALRRTLSLSHFSGSLSLLQIPCASEFSSNCARILSSLACLLACSLYLSIYLHIYICISLSRTPSWWAKPKANIFKNAELYSEKWPKKPPQKLFSPVSPHSLLFHTNFKPQNSPPNEVTSIILCFRVSLFVTLLLATLSVSACSLKICQSASVFLKYETLFVGGCLFCSV